MSKSFVLIGAAGYIAPKHMEAIKATGNTLVAAYDKSDSVGIIDHYFPRSKFFTEFERFDRYIERLKADGKPVDYLVVCSPNYLHDSHIRFGLKHDMHVICEKPIVLNTRNLSSLEKIEEETSKKVNTILQLRLHENAIALKNKISKSSSNEKHEVELTYISARGDWYYASWKGEEEKSGGIATNIGIHLFDLLIWLFGDVVESKVYLKEHDKYSGYLELENAKVKWFLSINEKTLPAEIQEKGQRTYRSLNLGEEQFDFTKGFTDLHIKSYQQILKGNGFGIKDSFPSISICENIRSEEKVAIDGNAHELANLPLDAHPFDKGS